MRELQGCMSKDSAHAAATTWRPAVRRSRTRRVCGSSACCVRAVPYFPFFSVIAVLAPHGGAAEDKDKKKESVAAVASFYIGVHLLASATGGVAGALQACMVLLPCGRSPLPGGGHTHPPSAAPGASHRLRFAQTPAVCLTGTLSGAGLRPGTPWLQQAPDPPPAKGGVVNVVVHGRVAFAPWPASAPSVPSAPTCCGQVRCSNHSAGLHATHRRPAASSADRAQCAALGKSHLHIFQFSFILRLMSVRVKYTTGHKSIAGLAPTRLQSESYR